MNSRWDRDEQITVLWDNVADGLDFYFRKRVHDDTLGFPYYDYDSIMGDGEMDFSGNGKPTTLSPEPVGQLDHLSSGDIALASGSQSP